MRDAADMPELEEDFAAGLMHGRSDFSPAFDLSRVINSRRPRIALALLRNLGSFSDDERCRGALAIIFDVEIIRRIGAMGCAVARQRRHDDPAVQFESAKPEGREENG